MPLKPQPDWILLVPDCRLVVPPLEEPVAFSEEVDEADIVDGPLTLVVFDPPLVVFQCPLVVEDELLNVNALP